MPINYRPTAFTPSAGSDSVSPMSGSQELSHAGLSASLECQLSPADVRGAHQFFQAPADNGALAHSAFTPRIEPAALMPGADVAASGLAVPGAEPISPMIQMIMKLPGIGAINSFFEALFALFVPGPDMFNALDLGTLAGHAQGAVASLSTAVGEHVPLSLSLLPANAPILQSLGQGMAGQLHGFDASILGKATATVSEHGLSPLSREAMNVSGSLDPLKPQFEAGAGKLAAASAAGRTELVSGPAMGEGLLKSHISGASRLFSDRLGAFSSPALTTSQTVPLTQTAWPSPMNVNASAVAPEAAVSDSIASGPSMSQNVGGHLGALPRSSFDGSAALGPSGAVSDRLGSQSIIASDSVPTYRPTFGSGSGIEKAMPDSGLGRAASEKALAANDSVANVAGLKAKQLTLPGVKAPAAGHPSLPGKHSPGQIAHHKPAAAGARSGAVVDQSAHKAIHKVDYGDKASSAAHAERTASNAGADSRPGTAAEPGAPAAAAGTYRIKAGDNLWDIAAEHLGNGTRWQEIYKLNEGVIGSNPDLIHCGTTIKLPGAVSDAAAPATYVVKAGDNLWDIADKQLGGGEHWGELYRANSQVIGDNPRLILPGQELSLPGGANVELAAGQPASTAATGVPPTGGPSSAAAASTPAAQATPVSFEAPARPASPVLPAATAEPVSGAGAAQALPAASPIDLSKLPASPITNKPIVSSSLRPDLSFLSGKPARLK